MECRLDEHLKFTGKTSNQRKYSRSALTDAYVDERVARKKGSTNKYQYRPTSAGEGWIGGPLEVRTHPLPPPSLACVMQDLKLLSFNVQWFRDLGASFSSFGCFVFEIWVLRSSFSSASFSKLPKFRILDMVERKRLEDNCGNCFYLLLYK